MKFTNHKNIPLSMAVWLAGDEYDHVDNPKYISATSLLKSVRQLILSKRIEPTQENATDISVRMPSRMGTALHDAIERAWKGNYAQALQDLGYPPGVINAVRINPKPEELSEDIIPVWLEERTEKEFNGWTIGGKFDMVLEYRLRDVKSTSVFTFLNKSNDEKFRLQGSIYRWLNPDKIKHDHMYIDYIFTDWSAKQALGNKGYPQERVMEYPLELKSVGQTELFIATKLAQLDSLSDAHESLLPECTDEELWRSDPVYKYYTKPENKRCQASFDNQHDANRHLAEKGKGIIVMVPGEVKACKYCAGYALCSQKDKYLASGELTIN